MNKKLRMYAEFFVTMNFLAGFFQLIFGSVAHLNNRFNNEQKTFSVDKCYTDERIATQGTML